MTEFVPDFSGLDLVRQQSRLTSQNEVAPSARIIELQQMALAGLEKVASFNSKVRPVDAIRQMFGVDIEDIPPAA